MKMLHKYLLREYNPESPFIDIMSFWGFHKEIIKKEFEKTGNIDKALVGWWDVLCGEIDLNADRT